MEPLLTPSAPDSHYHSFTIAQALKKIENNELVLPLIQRNFVWGIDRITKLFDSILQEYPINSMLFWQVPSVALESVQMYAFIRNFTQYHWFNDGVSATEHGERHQNKSLSKANGNLPDEVLAVLDGQQRLTSFYMGLCGTYAERLWGKWAGAGYQHNYPPKALYLCVSDLAPASDTLENYRTNRYQLKWMDVKWDESQPGTLKHRPIRSNRAKTELWLHVGEVLKGNLYSASDWADLQVEACRTFAATLVDADLPEEDFNQARLVLTRLHKAVHSEHYIRYYLDQGSDLARAVETFIRINNGGMSIEYSDLLFSIINSEWKQLNAREEVEKLENALRNLDTGMNLEKGFILKAALVMVENRNLRFELSQFSSKRVQSMQRDWPTIASAIMAAGQTLAASQIHFFYTPALVTVVAYYWYKKFATTGVASPISNNEQVRIRQFLIRARLLWSSEKFNTETKISHLINIISAHFNAGQTDFPFNELVTKSWSVDMRLNKAGEKGGIHLATLATQSKHDPTTKFLLGLLQTNIQRQVAYDIDHCYPHSEAWKVPSENWSEEHELLSDSLPNLQLLSEPINRSKGAQHFHAWYAEIPHKLLTHDNYQRDLGVKSQVELHSAHYYPADLSEAYSSNDTHADKLVKFQRFYEGRHAMVMERLHQVFQDPE